MRARMAVMVAALSLAGCQRGPTVTDAWVRLPAVPGRPAAGYATVRGDASSDRVLVGVSSPVAERAELHESMAGDGGTMAMQPLGKVKLAQGETMTFAPGGKHVMLFGLSPDLRAGGTVPITFGFADGTKVTVDARLVGAGDRAP